VGASMRTELRDCAYKLRTDRILPRLACTALLALLLCFASVSAVNAISSNNVPLDDWSYVAIEKLSGMGLIDSSLLGTKPYTRLEAARLVQEALDMSKRQAPSPLIAGFLARLQQQFGEELGILSRGGAHHETAFKPIEQVQVRYGYSAGAARPGVQLPNGKVSTFGTPLVYNNNGILYNEHHNGSLQFSSSLVVGDLFSAYIEPIFLARQNGWNLSGFDKLDADVLYGYGKLTGWNVEVEAGRDSLWWGQGYRGSLLLTDNAFPMEMVKVSNPKPVLLPWVFSYLGPFKYTVFASRLEDDRIAPHNWLGGARVDFKPVPNLEIGLATTFMWDGENRPSFALHDLGNILAFTSSPNDSKAFQLAAVDGRYRMPFFHNAMVYFELASQDTEKTTSPSGNYAYLVGLYIPAVSSDGKADLRFEFADDSRGNAKNQFWYESDILRSGYSRDGLLLGHPMGSEALDAFVRSTYYFNPDLVMGVDFDYVRRKDSQNPQNTVAERTSQVGADLTYNWNVHLSLSGRYGYGKTKNFNFLADRDDTEHLMLGTVKYRF
jgi:hypothetical protein